ncbi:aminoglycoside phosphotransferase [Mumia zhuanghuii]|uniref:Glucosamine kinase n=1 Tax=Mumia zhuanghuii TaxID=2585211 RepID=A0A5C4MDA7_9ACTN|nr:aminoglycoside phosphotransferase [Mumia zhuanghuii]TNC32928.1 aminoglycoside phosphotransferase [Mumia zhuanghuii]TNC35673.1 aminoglycoside phosphotransferase [Mumia zhuanghuii]
MPGDGAALGLVEALDRGSDGAFTFTRWDGHPVAEERVIDVDQSNESVIVHGPDSGAVVKWVVRVSDDGDPAPVRVGRLVEAGFDAMPTPWGMVQWQPDPTSAPALVAMVTALVPDARDGWQWAVQDAVAYASGVLSLHDSAAVPGTALGRVVASMHLGLADTSPPVADAAHAAAWHSEALAALDDALALMDGAELARLERHADALRSDLGALGHASGSPLVPIHGDLHVGQILRGADGAYRVTDFDGNPVATTAERLAPQPAAVDVAGMAQSLDHVAYVVLHRTPGVDAAAVERWRTTAVEAFLSSYRATLEAAGRGDLLDELLLVPMRMRQVCREYVYAGRHLPHWRYVPDRAVRDRYEAPSDVAADTAAEKDGPA